MISMGLTGFFLPFSLVCLAFRVIFSKTFGSLGDNWFLHLLGRRILGTSNDPKGDRFGEKTHSTRTLEVFTRL